MKKISKILCLFLALSLFGVAKSKAQEVYVGARMHYGGPVVVRPVRPSREHVWVKEEWVPQGGRYAWHGGYWAAPPRPGAYYVQGHWRHTFHGWVWVRGYWR